MSEIFISVVEKCLFLYFMSSFQNKNFIFKNFSLSVLIGTYDVSSFLKRVLRSMF